MKTRRIVILAFILGLFFSAPLFSLKAATVFSIDENYDISGRSETSAVMIKETQKLVFFVEEVWWNNCTNLQKTEVLNNLESLSQEFSSRIYPILTSSFGTEWKPGVDGDERITILFSQMKDGVGGYFRTADEYIKLQMPESNEREMIYVTTGQVSSSQLKVFVAHEFVHLITFNQKDRIQGVSEEIWLNEARAEYSSTLLGYDTPYEGSNLERRVKTFLDYPDDPITEWQGKKQDYGALNIFFHYFVEKYGLEVLSSSMMSGKIGIASINDVLTANGIKKDFSQVFTDWTIAAFLNDCSLGNAYCFSNPNLKQIHVTPTINFLPFTGKSTLSVTNVTKNWAGDWQKIIGGSGVLNFEFNSLEGLNFKVPYLILKKDGTYALEFLSLDKTQRGEVFVTNFGSENVAFIAIPTLQTKMSVFDGSEPTYPFTMTVSILERTPQEEADLINELLRQIALLKEEIQRLQNKTNSFSCQRITSVLKQGMSGNEVRCLQEFLKSQGTTVYPEGLVTGYYGNLTKQAVIRFQERHSQEILAPLGLGAGTGVVGSKTIAVVNRLLSP